jgi:hypothetical protein
MYVNIHSTILLTILFILSVIVNMSDFKKLLYIPPHKRNLSADQFYPKPRQWSQEHYIRQGSCRCQYRQYSQYHQRQCTCDVRHICHIMPLVSFRDTVGTATIAEILFEIKKRLSAPARNEQEKTVKDLGSVLFAGIESAYCNLIKKYRNSILTNMFMCCHELRTHATGRSYKKVSECGISTLWSSMQRQLYNIARIVLNETDMKKHTIENFELVGIVENLATAYINFMQIATITLSNPDESKLDIIKILKLSKIRGKEEFKNARQQFSCNVQQTSKSRYNKKSIPERNSSNTVSTITHKWSIDDIRKLAGLKINQQSHIPNPRVGKVINNCIQSLKNIVF